MNSCAAPAARCEGRERKRIEHLCRLITRPALDDEQVHTSGVGQIELKRKTSWLDGTTHLVRCPLELMPRLAVLVSRPELSLGFLNTAYPGDCFVATFSMLSRWPKGPGARIEEPNHDDVGFAS